LVLLLVVEEEEEEEEEQEEEEEEQAKSSHTSSLKNVFLYRPNSGLFSRNSTPLPASAVPAPLAESSSTAL
jgi:hypothetical protein